MSITIYREHLMRGLRKNLNSTKIALDTHVDLR